MRKLVRNFKGLAPLAVPFLIGALGLIGYCAGKIIEEMVK